MSLKIAGVCLSTISKVWISTNGSLLGTIICGYHAQILNQQPNPTIIPPGK